MVAECGFEGCHREQWSKGFCGTHYRQQRDGRPLTPIRRKRTVHGNYKECARCEKVKTLDEFYTYSNGRTNNSLYVTSKCRACHLQFNKEMRLKKLQDAD